MRGLSLHRLLARGARHVGAGQVAGRLLDLGAYPGAVSDAHGSIAGEVYEIGAPALWAVLDSAEGPQYHRGEVGVRMDDGAERVACMYWYRGPLRGIPIPGGDYRAHVPARSIHHDPRAEEAIMPVEPAVLVKDDQDHLIHPLHHPSDHLEPMVYVRGRGATITDIQGREYIDGLAGLWNVNVGHGREELAQAAFDQMKQLAYFSAYTGSTNIPAVQLASKLISLAYPNMQAVFFTSGGAESNESAFKTARFYWKTQGKPDKVKVIARTLAYHGVTLQAMSATGMSPYWKMFEPRVPNFLHVPTCYPYRQEGAVPGETAGQTAARLLEEAILREGPDTVAAFIAEPIHGGGGVLYPTDDYFPLVRQVCDRHKVLFIGDEVITGFCRTGKWFALEHWNVQPDIMSFAKGVSSGYLPLGGIMVSKAIKQAMDEVKPEDRWMHAYTYSGHPTCCAVGLKNIEIMERERLWERAAAMGKRLHDNLHAAFGDHKHVGDIRSGKGLLAAIELVEDKATKAPFAADKKVGPRVLQEMAKRGVMTRARLEHIFFSPPLVISEAEVDRLVSVTRDALKAVTGV